MQSLTIFSVSGDFYGSVQVNVRCDGASEIEAHQCGPIVRAAEELGIPDYKLSILSGGALPYPIRKGPLDVPMDSSD